ncbi:aromatic hydrocarbon degradation protein [Epibacterium ulvae]|uniref:OmpP1/FadL family transporter n=1 Tax=Epibacterium ulvae TaxID=1156985 RepID=UPI001BFCB594|nr:outer membrane protein transport protein [Epibacterium ulvae]MBT8156003.1 aromatic hydrocarbon degradation protein [Epibacterium ulvae]
MKTSTLGVVAPVFLLHLSSATLAAGLDRTNQPIGILFENGNYVEFSFGRTDPSGHGVDSGFDTDTGDVLGGFNLPGAGIKLQLTDKLSAALIYDKPWGANTAFPGEVGNTTSMLGGTRAFAESDALTGVLRYKFNESWSVHGGLRYQEIAGNITLSGLAYGPANGYNVALERDGGVGWLVGGAYERPDIAMRLAVTYNSEVDHDFPSRENIAPGVTSITEATTAQSVNIDFQTGITPKTLLLANVRWADHTVTDLVPTALGSDLINLDNAVTYALGVAHRFNERWVGSVSFAYDDVDGDNVVSPLSPIHGYRAITLGLRYENDNMRISGGLRYTELGDALAAPGGGTVRARFDDSDAISLGIKVGFSF